MNSNPKCLIAVPTFRRPKFLPRILACFKRLDYSNKKLVIINDDPETKYTIAPDPDIELINIDTQLPLSVKRNMFASWDFDVMFPLDDDDLFLPMRLKNHVEEYQKDDALDLYRNCSSFDIAGGRFGIGTGGAFTNSSFTRTGYFKSLGYTAFDQSNYDDIYLNNSFTSRCNVKITTDITKRDFIYQWDNGSYHNTFYDDSFSIVDIDKDTSKSKITGNIHLHYDYDCYDNINNISNIVDKSGTGVEIKFNENMTDIILASNPKRG